MSSNAYYGYIKALYLIIGVIAMASFATAILATIGVKKENAGMMIPEIVTLVSLIYRILTINILEIFWVAHKKRSIENNKNRN